MESYTNGQTATIQLIGSVDDAQSGLTINQKYFLQEMGHYPKQQIVNIICQYLQENLFPQPS